MTAPKAAATRTRKTKVFRAFVKYTDGATSVKLPTGDIVNIVFYNELNELPIELLTAATEVSQ